jgi:hypothetical protein
VISSALARRVRCQEAEVLALQNLFADTEWPSQDQSTSVSLLAYTLGRVNELDYFKSLLKAQASEHKKTDVLSAEELLNRYATPTDISGYLEKRVEYCLKCYGKPLGEVFEDVYEIYELSYLSQALGLDYRERLARVISAVSTYLDSTDSNERIKFERSVLNLKSSNLCYTGEHPVLSRNPSTLLAPLLVQSTSALLQKHEEISRVISERFDTGHAESSFHPNILRVLKRLIELAQQDGERLIRTLRDFKSLFFPEEMVTVIPDSLERTIQSSVVIVATTPRYRNEGSIDRVLSSLIKFLEGNSVDRLAVFIVSSHSGLRKIFSASDFTKIEFLIHKNRNRILIPLAIRDYELDVVRLD